MASVGAQRTKGCALHRRRITEQLSPFTPSTDFPADEGLFSLPSGVISASMFLPLIVVMLAFGVTYMLSNAARHRYAVAIARAKKERAPTAHTASEIALAFLESEGVTDVQIAAHDGVVTDFYDPARKRLFLRSAFVEGTDLASWAVALHEAAHATLEGEQLAEFKWRQSCIRMARYLPMMSALVIILLSFLKVMNFKIGLMAFAALWVILFLLNAGSVATEWNANKRLQRFLDKWLVRHPAARERLDEVLSAVATREMGDLVQSPRYFFLSALPGTSKLRPTDVKPNKP